MQALLVGRVKSIYRTCARIHRGVVWVQPCDRWIQANRDKLSDSSRKPIASTSSLTG